MFHMVTRRSVAAVGLAAVLAAPMAWSQDAPPVRVRGAIERVEGPVYVVKSRDGSELKIVLAENAVAAGLVKATLADIKQGSFVGIAAMPQPRGTSGPGWSGPRRTNSPNAGGTLCSARTSKPSHRPKATRAQIWPSYCLICECYQLADHKTLTEDRH
jgi:hypothetical protein